MGHETPAFALPLAEAPVEAVVRSILAGTRPVGKTAQARLGLGELPSRIDRLDPGMLYGLACDQQAVRLPIIAGSLAASLRSGKQCVLLTPADPRILLRKLRLSGFSLHAQLKARQLAIYQVTRDAAKHLFRLGAGGLLAQLEEHIAQREAFIVLDEADALFMTSDPLAGAEAAQLYVEWSAAAEHTLLALFTPAAHAPRDYLTLRRIAENFGGFGLAKPAEGGAVLEIRHWFSAEGPSARESFELRLHGTEAAQQRPEVVRRFDDQLPPVDTVVCARGALASFAPTWKSWQEAASIVAALDVARHSEAATLLLPFERPGDYPNLFNAVAAIRAMRRPHLRVVVRERGLRLRAWQVLALMRLGASSIIPADVPDAAAKRMTDALQGTRFTRPYDIDLQQVEDETIGLLQSRPMSAASFCDAVERLLAAADGFDIESCLVRLELDQVEPWKALALARRHSRDFVGLTDNNSAWLFLFGCRADVAAGILKRVFIAPPEQFCSKWEMQHDADGILNALRSLRQA
jgi:hypothetical protein